MSSIRVDLGNTILAKLQEQKNLTISKNARGSSKHPKRTDRSKRDKVGSRLDPPKIDESARPSKQRNRQAKAIASKEISQADKPTSLVIESGKMPTSKLRSGQKDDQNKEKEGEKSDASTSDQREILLQEIKALGGTEEDLELIELSASEDMEIHQDSQVDSELIHDVKDFLKGLDFPAVNDKNIEQDQEEEEIDPISPTKIKQPLKSSNISRQKKKNSITTGTFSRPSATHLRKDKKKKTSRS